MLRRTRSSRSVQTQIDPWPGFTDIMTGLLLIFVFVITLFTVTETILSRSLTEKDTELDRLQRQVSLKLDEIEKLKHEIDRLKKMFGSQVKKTTSLQELLKQLQEQLETALAQITEKSLLAEQRAADIEEKKRTLEQQSSEMSALLSQLREKSAILQEKEKTLGEMSLKLDESGRKLSETESDIQKKADTITELRAKIDTLNSIIAQLNKKMAEYIDQVNSLNKILAEAKQSEKAQTTKASDLQKEISSLRAKLDEISGKLAAAQEKRAEEFRVSQLVELLGEKEKEIDRLRKLAKYRSEFLAKLEQIFQGVPDIKVHGDRFVFQSEILFASGKADINEGGKKELDKFVKIYNEMVPKIPKDLDLVILIQGYTDDVPIRSARYRSNWELASARAMEVVKYLIEKGIPPSRVGASSFGEFHPVDPNLTSEARRLNRRIEIKITTL